jgi:hypothetical protein
LDPHKQHGWGAAQLVGLLEGGGNAELTDGCINHLAALNILNTAVFEIHMRFAVDGKVLMPQLRYS